MSRKFGILMIAILTAVMQCGCENKSSVAQAEAIEVEPTFTNHWVEATRFIQKTLETTPGANEKISKEKTDALFNQLVEDIENGLEDETVIYYRLCHILASMQHIHLRLEYCKQDQYPQGKPLAMAWEWTEEGLVLLGIEQAYEEEVGSTVMGINGYTLDEIIERYATIYGQETEAGKKNCVYRLNTADLKYLGIMKENDVSLTMALKNDKEEEKEIVYSLESKEGGKRSYLMDKEKIPFTYGVKNNFQNYSYVEKPEDGTMYFQYLACAGVDGLPFENFFEEMIMKMKAQDQLYDTLVIDVRWNGGGDRTMFQNQLIKNKEYLRTKHICIITGQNTASAGVQLI